MNRIFFIFLLLLTGAGCTKTQNNTNNFQTTTPPAQPAFEVSGVKDIIFTNWFGVSVTLDLSVIYLDSAQENVSLSLSSLPAGITMDTGWNNNGIPSYTTSLPLFDTSFKGAAPGNYPVTLIATTPSGKQKSYPFTIKVQPVTWGFLGKYNNCFTYCPFDTAYADSVYVDPVIANKIWFANFSNSGNKIYGIISLPATITIPNQTFGGFTYHGQASFSAAHTMQFDVSSDCIVIMN
jgi:hypothetical protein